MINIIVLLSNNYEQLVKSNVITDYLCYILVTSHDKFEEIIINIKLIYNILKQNMNIKCNTIYFYNHLHIKNYSKYVNS